MISSIKVIYLPAAAFGRSPESKAYCNQITQVASRSSPVLPLYSYLLTFNLEVFVIWKRKAWDLVTIVFVLNRYLPVAWILVYYIDQEINYTSCTSSKGTVITQGIIVAVAAISQAGEHAPLIRVPRGKFTTSAAFAGVRIYAIYLKNIKYGILVFVLYVIPAALRIVSEKDEIYLLEIKLNELFREFMLSQNLSP